MKVVIFATLLAFSTAASAQVLVNSQEELLAKKGGKKSEPAPKDRDERKGGEESPHPRQETYEGNDRTGSGGGFDGSSSGEGSGFDSEIFRVSGGKKYSPKTNVLKTEDRGDVVVYTAIEQEDVSASETCTKITTTVVDKSSQKVVSEEVEEYCNNWPL